MSVLRALLLALALAVTSLGSVALAGGHDATCAQCAVDAAGDCDGHPGTCPMACTSCVPPALAAAAQPAFMAPQRTDLPASDATPFASLALAPEKAPPKSFA